MNSQEITLDQIKCIGMEALSERLGPVGMIKFLQQMETGWGDYTRDREKWLNDPDLRSLFNAIKADEENRGD